MKVNEVVVIEEWDLDGVTGVGTVGGCGETLRGKLV